MSIDVTGLMAALGLVLGAVAVMMLGLLLARRRSDPTESIEALARTQQGAMERLHQGLRSEVLEQARGNRAELSAAIDRFTQQSTQQAGTIARMQHDRMEGFALQLSRLTEANEARLGEIRQTLEDRLRVLQQDNGMRLEEMRRTVDEKLHATLEQRLGESFKLVSAQLEQVHSGLGEMRLLAADVGDLKRVLSNVKTRGIWGEVQLGALLEQMLAPQQYSVNVATVPGSQERVEFAIRMPGRGSDSIVWLPIDAKFPREDYERLQLAHDRADLEAVEAAGRALEARIRLEAKTIREKYLAPPHTTDFALLFLPTEGLYAEVVRRPGVADALQREHRVVIAGPTTLAALLNSLQMGFRTLAIEQRSSEVWRLLGAVKTEFGKFGDVLAKTKSQLETASRSLGQAEVRTRAIERKLRDVETLPEADSQRMLEQTADDGQIATAPSSQAPET